MMALVAELSMKQALAIKLQQEMRDKEQFLMTVSARIDQGLPPPKETEIEWLKILRNEKVYKEAAEARARVSFCSVTVGSSVSPPSLLIFLAELLAPYIAVCWQPQSSRGWWGWWHRQATTEAAPCGSVQLCLQPGTPLRTGHQTLMREYITLKVRSIFNHWSDLCDNVLGHQWSTAFSLM